jgi:threonine dehydratase
VEDLPQVDLVAAPLSGGGLLGDIALALKSASGQVHTLGVTMARCPVMVASLVAGRPILLPQERTLVDSLMGKLGYRIAILLIWCGAWWIRLCWLVRRRLVKQWSMR